MKKVLLTNDDGLTAIGLVTLASVLASRYDVYVVAPDRERSGVSHGFTLLNPLRCDPAPEVLGESLARSAYRCSGTPVDCVKMGLLAIFPEVTFDLVVSGINRGANMSVDVLYSGTVSGALEALIMGLPAVAVSLASRGRESAARQHFETAAQVCLDYLEEHESQILANRNFIVNMNVPGIPRDEIKGIKVTHIGRCRYSDCYHAHADPFGRPYYWLDGEIVIDDVRETADIVAVRNGFVSVSPLGTDLTSPAGLTELARWSDGVAGSSAARAGSKPARSARRPAPGKSPTGKRPVPKKR